MFQIDLNNDLKEKPDTISTGNTMILNMSDSADIYPIVGKYVSICLV